MSEAILKAPVAGRRIGLALSGLAIAFLTLDAVMKLLVLPEVVTATGQLGYPTDPVFIRGLGLALAACTVLYAWPGTAVLGAVLVTGWLGGAVASHLRLGHPLFTHVLFGVYVGAPLWAGLWLREPRLRRLLPLRAATPT